MSKKRDGKELIKEWAEGDIPFDLYGDFSDKQKQLLTNLALTNHIVHACHKAGVGNGTHYYWLENVKGYADAVEAIRAYVNSMLIRTAIREATGYWVEEEEVIEQTFNAQTEDEDGYEQKTVNKTVKRKRRWNRPDTKLLHQLIEKLTPQQLQGSDDANRAKFAEDDYSEYENDNDNDEK